MIERLEFIVGRYVYGMTLAQNQQGQSQPFAIQARAEYTQDSVQRDRQLLLDELGFQNLVSMKQVHSADSAWADTGVDVVEGVDALLCSETGVLLGAQVADCAGIVVYHPKKTLFAVIHSGWRGTQQSILPQVITKLCTKGECSPSDLHAWCSPCASAPAYLVQNDVQQFFADYCVPVDETHFALDHKAALYDQLRNSGLREQNIEMSQECTMTSANMYSYRRDGQRAGRMTVFIGAHEEVESESRQ